MGTTEQPLSPERVVRTLWRSCACSSFLTGHSAGHMVGRGLASRHLVFPSCCGPRGYALIFTLKQGLCLLLMEERRGLPGSVFSFAARSRSHKTGLQ